MRSDHLRSVPPAAPSPPAVPGIPPLGPVATLALVFLIGSALLLAAPTAAQEQDRQAPRVYHTVHCGGGGPKLDGVLDDRCWDLVEWSGDFIQYRPAEGEPPSQQTQFKVLYNDQALYFGIRAFDSDPERIVSHLARRDWFPGDWVEVNIDSYGDDRTAFSFTASVSGTRGDEFISNDGNNWDGSWDPVWEFETHVDELGWTAEIRIPLSQLRFDPENERGWGLQVQRRVFREDERSVWAPMPPDQTGWVSRFGELRGIQALTAGRNLELTPYTVGRTESYPAVDGSPFEDGRDGALALGLDGKMAVTGNLTLDFTVNPDFGQVEADPSEVNLSAFETFFQERRPFFIEGRNIFDFQVSPAITGGSFTSDRLFYSRRIGGRPHARPDLEDGEFADSIEQTSILGAAKLSGKTPDGLSIGVLQALTAEERVDIEGVAGPRRETVEPLTNTFVGRVQQDLRGGASHVGFIGTAVHRRLGGTGIDFLHRQAYAGGVDFHHSWHDRRWYVEGASLFSRVQGSAAAIDRTQRSSSRYYQRPDNGTADYDPTRTSLSGTAHSLRLGLSRAEGIRFQTGITTRTPGFEINDAGFQRSANEINQFGWISHRWARPVALFRDAQINFNQWNDWDYDGVHLRTRFNTNGNVQLRNYWRTGLSLNRSSERISNTELRGGPASKWPGESSISFWVNSDARRDLTVNFGGYTAVADDGGGDYREIWASTAWRPSDALRVSFAPSFSQNRPDMQYVGTESFGDEERYLFASLEQETLRFSVRLDYTITPDLTLQYYGSPFLSAGRYEDFRRITSPRADRYEDRFARLDGDAIRLEDGDYVVDEDADGNDDYSFGRPDFDVRDFNSNLVLRWEYAAGSTLFLVWSQQRSGFDRRGDLEIGRDLGDLFDDGARNVFLVKFSKWLSL